MTNARDVIRRPPLVVSLAGAPVGWRAPQARIVWLPVGPGGRNAPRVRMYPLDVVTAYQKRVRDAVFLVLRDSGWVPGHTYFTGPVGLRIEAVFHRPRGDHRVRTSLPREPWVGLPDATNVQKLIEDVVTAMAVVKDDRQVANVQTITTAAGVPAHRCAKGRPCPADEPEGVRFVVWDITPRPDHAPGLFDGGG